MTETIETPTPTTTPTTMETLYNKTPGTVFAGADGVVKILLGSSYASDGGAPEVVDGYTPYRILPADARPRVRDVPASHIFAGHALNTGADPEVFATHADGTIIPAFDYLPSKEDRKGNAPFWDGFQAEFTTLPTSCHGFLTDYVRDGLIGVIKAARAVDPDARLSISATLPIPLAVRLAVDPVHLQLGCAPSRNAYGEPRLAVPDPASLAVRFAGCHMHFGWKAQPTPDVLTRIIRLLDACVGVATVALGEGFNCPERRNYYGRAGEYRYHEGPKGSFPTWDYTFASDSRLEYRVPDTILLSHPATYNLILDFARVVFRMGVAGLDFLWDAPTDEVRRVINEYDVKGARNILENNRIILSRMLEKSNPGWGATTEEWVNSSLRAFFDGIGSVVRDPTDLIGNWWLDRPTVPPAIHDPQPLDSWITESYSRKPEHWPTGRIWSSAAKLVAKGEKV